MLAEVQAANAALSAITGAIQNGKDIGDIAGSCAEYFNTKSVIARRSNKRGSKSQIQTFMEFEKLRKQEYRLREIMIYQGDPGMWDRWLKFQSECKRARALEEKKKKQSGAAEMEEVMQVLRWIGGGVSFIVTMLFTTFELLEFFGAKS